MARVFYNQECDNCYGNGCLSCGMRGYVESAEDRKAREDYEDDAYDRWKDDQMEGGR